MITSTLGAPFLKNLYLDLIRSITSEPMVVCPVHQVQKQACCYAFAAPWEGLEEIKPSGERRLGD